MRFYMMCERFDVTDKSCISEYVTLRQTKCNKVFIREEENDFFLNRASFGPTQRRVEIRPVFQFFITS